MISNHATASARKSERRTPTRPSRTRPEQPSRATTVMVASAEPVTLSGLASVIGGRDEFDVIHTESDITAVLESLPERYPDVLAAESCFEGVCVLDVVKQAAQTVPVLVVSRHRSPLALRRALQCGAKGFVSRESSAEALITALGSVASGSAYMEPGLVAELAEHSTLPALTERELSVLYLVAIGYTSAETAATLHISARTVEACRASIRDKLGLKSRAQVHSYAEAQGLLANCGCVPVAESC